ncbi:MAG: ATP-binding protein, partial [Pseudomonadales bacterium]
ARDFRTPESTIVVRLYRQDLYCYLEVENQGPHIPDSMQGKLFSSMVSARQGGTGKAHFGLGLYIVRMIALYHEGEVSAHNLVNPQSVMFRVRLPVLLV